MTEGHASWGYDEDDEVEYAYAVERERELEEAEEIDRAAPPRKEQD